MRTSRRAFAAAVAALTVFFCAASPSRADEPYRVSSTSRIKNLANIEGVRQSQLIGCGLVIGLNGTGDTLDNIPFTRQSLQATLERLGVEVRGQTIRTGNVAAVKVMANLAAIGTQGSRIDVTVSALGDAKSRGIDAAVWRSFPTDEYFKSHVKTGGIGLVKEVERALLAQQEIR